MSVYTYNKTMELEHVKTRDVKTLGIYTKT